MPEHSEGQTKDERAMTKVMAEAVAKERASRFGDGAEVTEDDTRMARKALGALIAWMAANEMVFYRP